MSEQSEHSESGSGAAGPRTGFWRRFVASLVDGIVIGVVQVILLAFLSDNAATAVVILIGLAYYTYFEGSASGQTPGKKALGIRVLSLEDGGPIGYGRAFIRYIGRIVSTIPLLLGYFWMIWDKEKQTWHDKFAGSVVVPESHYPVSQWP
ncbi:MAG: RDD family protein [Gaiellaceae bacterium MAG52_C11]|nr:RDD family protein [Candidatus Gaiellasilicea maunaloa]